MEKDHKDLEIELQCLWGKKITTTPYCEFPRPFKNIWPTQAVTRQQLNNYKEPNYQEQGTFIQGYITSSWGTILYLSPQK